MTSSSLKVVCHTQKHVCLSRKDLRWFNNPFNSKSYSIISSHLISHYCRPIYQNTENIFRQFSYFPAVISSLKAAHRDIYFPAHSIVNPSLLKTHWHPRESNKFSAVFAPCGSACVLLSCCLRFPRLNSKRISISTLHMCWVCIVSLSLTWFSLVCWLLLPPPCLPFYLIWPTIRRRRSQTDEGTLTGCGIGPVDLKICPQSKATSLKSSIVLYFIFIYVCSSTFHYTHKSLGCT